MSAPASPLTRTALHDVHREAGATFVDFHGWEMPIRYGSIPEEHQRVREAAGLFDLGHMGRLRLRGAGSEEWLQRVLTQDVEPLPPGRARYTLICNDDGGIIDDAIIYRLAAEDWLLVVNASNRERVVAWLDDHAPSERAAMEDRTHDEAMIAVQGPAAAGIAKSVLRDPQKDWDALRYYQITPARFPSGGGAMDLLVARTGYTGEDGFEVYLPAAGARPLWYALLEAGGGRAAPVGLGARDTLRLEAGMPLYGHELDETTDPFEAGLGFAVKLEKGIDFAGKQRLLERRSAGPKRRLRGFRVAGRRVARQGMPILLHGKEVGRITSGAPSPTLGCPIAMGWLDVEADAALNEDGTGLDVDLRGRPEPLVRVELPFWSRTRKRS